MPDYEDLILQRQEEMEIYEDDYDSWRLMYGKDDKTAAVRDQAAYQES